MKYYLLVTLLSQLIEFALTRNGRTVCYYPNWGVYRKGPGKFIPKDIDPYLCTHLIYSFGKVLVDEATIAASDEQQDIKNRGFVDFIDLKTKYNEDLKTLFAIGGYREGSIAFTPIAKSPAKRSDFARNTAQFLRKHDFDGLNIDWQFPNDQDRNGAPEDKENFVLLAQEIKRVYQEEAEQSGKPELLLSISIPGDINKIAPGYNLIELEKYVEFMNVLAYDYHFAFEPAANHHSALYPLPEEMEGNEHDNEGLNADSTINYILSQGVKPITLNLGIPLYGRTFTLEDENQNKIGSPATGQGKGGPATREDGYISYYEVCKNIKDNWIVERVNETAMGPYAYKGNQWVGYDDAGSILRKGEYAKRKGLGGLSFWSIDQDDSKALCGTRAYPLIKSGRQGYMRAKDPKQMTANRTPARQPLPPSSAQPSLPDTPEVNENAPDVQRANTINAFIVPLARPSNRKQLTDFPVDRSIQAEVESAVDQYLPPAPPESSRGFMQRIYVWITTANIFHNASPSTIESALNSNRHRKGGTRSSLPPADTEENDEGLDVRTAKDDDTEDEKQRRSMMLGRTKLNIRKRNAK